MSTQDLEQAVRTAANSLLSAVNDAKAGGLDIRWPNSAAGLASIAISETARAAKPAPMAQAEPTAQPIIPAAPAPAAPATTNGAAS